MSVVFKTLNKAILDSDLKIKRLYEEIDRIKETISQEFEIIKECREYIQNNCLHQNTHKVEGTYMQGGYDHVSESNYTIECTNCGKVLESKCIRGTYA